MPLARIDSTKGLIIDNQTGPTGNMTAFGNLPSSGDYAWIPSGTGPYANQGSAGLVAASAGAVTSPSSTGLWSSGRTGLRGYATNSVTDAMLNAVNNFTASWQSSSFTIELYLQIDYMLGVNGGRGFAFIMNDYGLGQNAIYILASTGSTINYTMEIHRGGSLVAAPSITAGLLTSRPVHLAVVFDRTNASAVTATTYVDGLVAVSSSLGSLAAFTNPFNQIQAMLGGSGILGWVNITASAKTAAQIRANTLLLKNA